MAIHNIYSRNEREIAHKIHRIQSKQSYHYKKWHELDMKKNVFIKKLGSKYRLKPIFKCHQSKLENANNIFNGD